MNTMSSVCAAVLLALLLSSQALAYNTTDPPVNGTVGYSSATTVTAASTLTTSLTDSPKGGCMRCDASALVLPALLLLGFLLLPKY